jgi:hypothetical protein
MLSPCPNLCGGTPTVIDPGPHRMTARRNAQGDLDALTDALLAMQGPVGGQDRLEKLRQEIAILSSSKQREKLRTLVLPMLQPDVVEVRCETCGAWCWDTTGFYAQALWNKAVDKLAHLKECCATSPDRRVDYDGMVIVKCAECGQRHLPLEPEEVKVG